MPTEDEMEMELMKREFEGMTEKEMRDFAKKGPRLYDVNEGHGRAYLAEQDGKYIFVYAVCEKFVKPGSLEKVRSGEEMPIFGLVVHSAEHAKALAKSFELMAEYITSKEGGK